MAGAKGAAAGCIKFLLTIFNAIFLITGVAVLALGVWFVVDLHKYLQMGGDSNKATQITLIVLGVIIFLVAIAACVCTCKAKHAAPLYLYAVFLVIIFFALLAIGIASIVFKGKIQDTFENSLNSTLVNDYEGDNQEQIDELQSELKCCGAESYTDWFASKWSGVGTNAVPKSCCKDDEKTCVTTGLPAEQPSNGTLDIYTEGCASKVLNFLDSKIMIIGGVVLGFAFLQLLGAVLACCLARQVKQDYQTV